MAFDYHRDELELPKFTTVCQFVLVLAHPAFVLVLLAGIDLYVYIDLTASGPAAGAAQPWLVPDRHGCCYAFAG